MFLEFVIFALIILVIYLWFKNREWKIRFEQKIKEFLEKEEERIREDAIKRSARTLSGKALEKLVPFLEKFPYDAHDIRWLGDPIDLVVFDGLAKENPNQIVFCEVKSGESELTKTQKKIKELVEKKRVKWEEFRIK
jgi:predicted Holliday junction resolvase-like endonuclease